MFKKLIQVLKHSTTITSLCNTIINSLYPSPTKEESALDPLHPDEIWVLWQDEGGEG